MASSLDMSLDDRIKNRSNRGRGRGGRGRAHSGRGPSGALNGAKKRRVPLGGPFFQQKGGP